MNKCLWKPLNYLNYIKDTTDYMNDFFVQRDSAYSYNLVTEFPDGSVQMIDNSASIDSEVLNQITSMVSMPNTPFHALAGREEYVTQTYEVIYGEYPSTDNPYEVVLVVDQYNSIPLGTLQALGIYDSSYQDPIEANKNPISFDDVLEKKYKIFTNDEIYYVEQKTTVVDKKGFSREIISANELNLETAFNSSLGHEVEIVGILRPKQGVTLFTSSTDINNYTILPNEFEQQYLYTYIYELYKKIYLKIYIDRENIDY